MTVPHVPTEILGDDPHWRDTVTAIETACVVADGRSPLNEQAHLDLAEHGLNGARLHLVGADGFALEREDQLFLAVQPAARERGLGAALLQISSARHAWSFGNHPGARALADDYGWQAERTLLQMTRRAGQPGLTQPTLEPGVVIRTYQEGDEAAFLQVNAAAFAQHPEQGALTADGLHERLSSPGLGPEGFFVAEIDGSLAGFHWTKLHPDGRGEVYVIGVTPAAQGRGLGNTLMARGLEHLAQSTRGADVLLYVEADNEPAVALYSKLGFEITQRDVQYTRR